MFENAGEVVGNFINNFLSFLWTAIQIPFGFWNSLPAWVHIAATVIILTIAALFTWAVWQLRFEWKYRT